MNLEGVVNNNRLISRPPHKPSMHGGWNREKRAYRIRVESFSSSETEIAVVVLSIAMAVLDE